MNISFKGIAPPHKIGKIYVYPISKDLSKSTINNYCKAISDSNKIGSGCNGNVFSLGMDLVIKKAKSDALVNRSLINEATKLDMLWNLEQELGLKLDNVQTGIAGFEFPNGASYLVSTLVQGAKPNHLTNPFNEKNLESLIDILTILDKGSQKDGRLMMYDLNLNNINVNKNKAGIFDFEYMCGEDFENSIQNRVIKNLGTASTHVSDTSNLQSNIRSFEYAGLYYYLNEMSSKDIKAFLSKYLTIKSKYHNEMSNYYSEKSKTSKFSEELYKIAKSEKAHSQLLLEPSDDILKSEAMKIQMANFVFVSGQWCKNPDLKFNPEQIIDYYTTGLKYFEKEFKKAKINNDINRKIYYQNCINLFKGWNRVLKLSEIMNEEQKARITNDKIKILSFI